MRGKRFTRTETVRHLKLGKRRRKLQKWRKPEGTHNKLRKKRFSYPSTPSIGYKRQDGTRGLVKGKTLIHVANLHELNQVKPHSLIVLSRTLGAKKKMEFLKIAREKKIEVLGAKEVTA